MEVMAYSQEYIHHNAMGSILSSTLTTDLTYLCTTSTNCQAASVQRKEVLIWNNAPGTTPCCIYSAPETDPMLKVSLKADVLIDTVLLTPSD